ncbi:DUF2975 domain-containing protein [Georgenia sp. Z1491]|uniref:DUF2975 domain-containing protein n=1 Tax=Georgenia sp. Z1491 TaxID=3416707 RepID=UPI003CE9DEC4
MLRTPWIVTLLRVGLVAATVWLTVLQVFSLPGWFAHDAGPEDAHVRIPAQVVAVVVLVCIQVVVVCIWRLLTLVRRDQIFGHESRRWVDAVVVALAVAWVLVASLALYLCVLVYLGPERDPGFPMLMTGVVVLSALPVLLMVVMRGLLRQASDYRAELAEVI